MYCKYCGNEIERGQKFCGKCGRAIDAHDTAGSAVAMHGGTSGRGNRLPRIIGACVTLAVVLVAVFSVVWNFSDRGGSFELYEQYERVEDAVASMVELYADDGGCIPPDSAQNLIDSIAGYASNSDDVTDFEVQDTGICMQLSSGLLYVYSPPIDHFLSGGNECRLVTYEPWWTDVQGVTSLHSTADVQDISDASEVDAWMNYVAEALENCSFTQQDNYNDDLVDIDALKGFGRNEFIVYYGHGGWFNKTQGSILTTGVEFGRETEEQHDEDIRAGRIGCADGRLFVTSAFFDEYYGNESLSGTNVFLLACESLHDDKLAKTLVTKGADVITGFTHSVTIDYGTRMLETMLGVDARIGLTDKSSAGEYLTFSEALEMAREANGEVDTFWDAFRAGDLAKRAECVCYPADKASATRISASAIGKDSQNGSVMDSSGSTQDFEVVAREFVIAWYNDWIFENGEMKFNQTPYSERCLPYIAEGTELYSEFSDETNFYAGSGSRLSRGAALSVATIDTTLGDGNTVTVDVAFYGAQNTITQEMFDQIKNRPANRNTWTLTFDDNGKIIELENGVAAEDGAESNASQYESTLSAYRSGLNSDTQPSYDAVNPEAWIAREYNKGRYAYALYDINGDGSDELLIGLEESTPVSEEGLEVYYRLYDLFTLDNGKPVRVLGDDGMTSLGYRAFCIPCENNIIATGGSGGATYHIREYWRLGERANEMSLSDRVTMDADEYTFEDSDGKSEVLSGEQARSRYEKGIIARYTPITKFVWHSL